MIRSEQMQTLQVSVRRGFAEAMVAHLAAFSPPLFRAVGATALRTAVTLGMERASGYGLTQRGPVQLYLELMLLFGSHFDRDPQYPWAAAILNDLAAGPQMRRAEQLYAQTRRYREQVAGPDDAYTMAALGRVRALAATPLQLDPRDLATGLLRELHAVYPEKAAHVGDAALAGLIHKAITGARRQQFNRPREVALVAVLMLAFGHGCGADPLYPWIGRTLMDPRITDPQARASRLERKALTWLDHVLAEFGAPASA
ncbi:MAG: hypothetical protein EA400_06440 [Chromatiaceae bacterium]|nr:MAG: hypothetical protein EA400_06440 [Chromatiaceae bacterium]